MTKNFNQEMYVRIKAKKNEPLFAFRKRVVRVVAKRTPATPATFVPEVMRVASLATSVEELTHTRRSLAWQIRGRRRFPCDRPAFWTMPTLH